MNLKNKKPASNFRSYYMRRIKNIDLDMNVSNSNDNKLAQKKTN